MVVVKNGHGLLDHGTLKSAVSQEQIDKTSLFFLHIDTNFVKLNVNLTIIRWP